MFTEFYFQIEIFSGCFCQEGWVKMFPVANNSEADLNNPCVQECDFSQCGGRK
jgi:hypothetical protein